MLSSPNLAEQGCADFQTSFSGEESEAKKIVASIKNSASFEAGYPEKGEEDKSEIGNPDVNHEDTPTSQDNGHESDITQYSSEGLESMQHVEKKGDKLAEPENVRRRSTRSKASGKVN